MFEPTAEMTRIHGMEDDITFERIRHLPRRTRVCSVHRQLSWACNKEIEVYEKDTRVTTNNLNRSKTAMQGRFQKLTVAKKKLHQIKIENLNRRASCPAVVSTGALMTQKVTSCERQRSQSDKDNDDDSDGILLKNSSKSLKNTSMNRAVSIMDPVGNNDSTSVQLRDPTTRIKRQQSLPAI